MTSHPRTVGGVFLSPLQEENNKKAESNKQWAIAVMNEYKTTGSRNAKELLIVYYMQGYVKKIAKRLSHRLPKCIDCSDLEQTAYVGLVDSIDKYNPNLNIKFESYARLRVEGAMKDYLRREDPVSRIARQRSKLIAKGIELFVAEKGQKPTNEELRLRLGLDIKEFEGIMKDVHVPCTLSFSPVEPKNDESKPSLSIDPKVSSCQKVDQTDVRKWLLEELDTYDKLIVSLHFVEGLTMLEVGKVVGYSESRVSQRIKHALSLLKNKLVDFPETILLMAS